MSSMGKIALLLLIICVTLGYAMFERSAFEEMTSAPKTPILKRLPLFEISKVSDSSIIKSTDLKGKTLYIHIWGTWCAPCEAELPSFIEFIKASKDKDAMFVLVAVNDKLMDVKKYIKRKKLVNMDNLAIAINLQEDFLPKFGTLKVPETFVFDKDLKHIKKYTGPQKWSAAQYYSDLSGFLVQ